MDDLLRLIEILNPADEPGRLTLIVRQGAEQVACRSFRRLLRAVQREGAAAGLVVRPDAWQHDFDQSIG